MLIYLVIFSISCLCSGIAVKYKKNDKRYIFIIFSAIAILLPSILAGIRSLDVGTDVKVYVSPVSKQALHSNSIIELVKISKLEVLYSAMVYLIMKIFGNVHVFMFISHLLICFLIYKTLIRKSDTLSVPIGLFAFYLLFYNMSLNLHRQFMAIAVVFYCTKYIEDKKPLKYLIGVIVAMGFHTSALLTIIFYPLFQIFRDNKNNKWKIVLVFTVILTLIFYNKIVYFMVYILNILPEKYYLLYRLSFDNLDFMFVDTLYRLCLLFLIFIQYKNLLKNDINNSVYTYLSIIDIIILQIGTFSQYAFRISLYTGIYMILIISQFIKTSLKDNAKITTIIMMVLSLFYWWYIYIHGNSSETFPYRSIFN